MKWRSAVNCPKISIFQLDNFVNIYWSKNEDRAVTSCFRSKTERELNAARKNNIVPGPGTYDLKLEVTTYAQSPAVKIRPFPKNFSSRWRQKDKWRCHFENIVWLCPLQQCRCHLIHLHLDQVHIKLLIIKALRKSSCLGNWSKKYFERKFLVFCFDQSQCGI